MSQKKRENFKKKHAGARNPGDLIPMDMGQRAFLKVRNRYVDNPEMEAIMAMDTKRGETKMSFGQGDSTQGQLTHQDFANLKAAQERKFSCKNSTCSSSGTEQPARHSIVAHKKELIEPDEMMLKKFGRQMQVVNHIAIICKTCGEFIQFIKYNLSNRRAAKDLLVSGPHQRVRSSTRRR